MKIYKKNLPVFLTTWLLLTIYQISYGEEPSPAPSEPIPTIEMNLGQSYPLDGIFADQTEVLPKNIALVEKRHGVLTVVPLKSGRATLEILQNGKKIIIPLFIHPATPSDSTETNLAEKIHFPKGIQAQEINGRWIVKGDIQNRISYQKLLLLKRIKGAALIVQVNPIKGLRESLCEQAKQVLNKYGYRDLDISYGGNTFYIKGNVERPEDLTKVLEITESIIPHIENLIPVPIDIDPTIQVKIYMMEISKSAHEALGLGWPSSTGAFLLSPFDAIQKILFSPQWNVQLRHLSNKGQAKVLAEPTLSVKNGSAAELHAGGEIPIKITGRFENKVIWKSYGLKIKIKIGGIAGKKIRTAIETESSTLDEASAVDGVPGIRSNKMNTEVDAESDFPILLTGLFQSSMSKDIEKMPILGSIPIIGELFKSRDFRNRESELLVILLPSLLKTTYPMNKPFKPRIQFDPKWRILD